MMPVRNHNRPLFRLEMLETRTLLAGDAVAITSSTSYLTNFNPASIDSQITIAGVGGGELTIDTTLLTSSVKSLKVSGFDKVVIQGSDNFDTLDLSLIGNFSGPGVDVSNTLNTYDVASITLHSLTGVALLAGHESRLEVFDSQSATIISTLDRLTVNTSNRLSLISDNPSQIITLEFDSGSANNLTPPPQVINPGDLTPDSVHTFNGTQSTYNVVVLSLAATQNGDTSLSKLRDALTQGDPDTVKAAFADYLKSIRLPASSYALTSTANTPVEINLAGIGRTGHFSDSFVETVQDHPVNQALTPSIGHDLQSPGTLLSAQDINRLLDKSGDGGPAKEVATPPTVEIVSSKISVSDQAPRGSDAHSLQDNGRPMLDVVRSNLSTLVDDVNSNLNTVTAYIVDRVGNELEPGALPALLVEARSSRSGRESSWVQI